MRYDRLLEGKTALITARGQPFIEACALLFARHGAGVALACPKKDSYETLLEEPRGFGMPCIYIENDLCDSADADALFEELPSGFSAPDVWLCCVDEYRPAFIDELALDDLRRMLRVNLSVPLQLMRCLAPGMAERRGSVIHVCSEYAVQGATGVSGYAATQGGALLLMRAYAEQWAPRGLRVNSIVLGSSFPPVGDDLQKHWSRDEDDLNWPVVQPISRRGTAEDLANAALFLACGMSERVSGEALYVNGAQHIVAHNEYFHEIAGMPCPWREGS